MYFRLTAVALLLAICNPDIGNAKSLQEINAEKLKTCHPQLAQVVTVVSLLTPIRVVTCYRTKKQQNKAYYRGNSKVLWPSSKHNRAPALAVDIIPAKFHYRSIGAFHILADLMRVIGKQHGLTIIWGGDWRMRDYSHFEIRADQI